MHIWKKMTLFIHERSVLPLAGKRRSPVITSVFGSYIDMTLFAVTKITESPTLFGSTTLEQWWRHYFTNHLVKNL